MKSKILLHKFTSDFDKLLSKFLFSTIINFKCLLGNISEIQVYYLVFSSSQRETTFKSTVEFAYNDFGYIVTSPMATLFVGLRRIFIRL